MGSETGQDNERPVHRVWIDAFELAVCQVTNAEYGIFLAATQNRPPLHWGEPGFSNPEQAVVGVSWFDAVAYCEWLSRVTSRHASVCLPKRNGNAPLAAESSRSYIPGATSRRNPSRITPRVGKQARACGPRRNKMHTDFATSARTFTNGARIGLTRDTIPISPGRNPQGPANGTRRASRGGSWRHYTKVSRCAARSSIPPEFQYADYGFRVACDIAHDQPLDVKLARNVPYILVTCAVTTQPAISVDCSCFAACYASSRWG